MSSDVGWHIRDNCDQCLSIVQCCSTSTEITDIRFFRRGAQDGHLHFDTAPELWTERKKLSGYLCLAGVGHGQSGWSSQLVMSVRCGPLAPVTCKIQCHRLMAIVQLLIQWACPLSGWMFVSEYVGTLPFSFVIIAGAAHTLSQIVSVCCGVMFWLLSNQNCFLFLFFQKWMAYIDWLKINFLSRKWISGVSCEINLMMVEKKIIWNKDGC